MDNGMQLVRILASNPDKIYTWRELSKDSQIPYATTYRNIMKFNDFFNIFRAGKARIIQLNPEHEIIEEQLVMVEYFAKKEYLESNSKLKEMISRINTTDCILLREDLSNKKEWNIFIIKNSSKGNPSFKNYEEMYDVKITPRFISLRDFEEMAKRKSEAFMEILKNHIVLNNPKIFWKVVLNEKEIFKTIN